MFTYISHTHESKLSKNENNNKMKTTCTIFTETFLDTPYCNFTAASFTCRCKGEDFKRCE